MLYAHNLGILPALSILFLTLNNFSIILIFLKHILNIFWLLFSGENETNLLT